MSKAAKCCGQKVSVSVSWGTGDLVKQESRFLYSLSVAQQFSVSSKVQSSEVILNVSQFHHHSLQLGVVLDGDLAVLPAEAWEDPRVQVNPSPLQKKLFWMSEPANNPPDILYPPKGISTGLLL